MLINTCLSCYQGSKSSAVHTWSPLAAKCINCCGWLAPLSLALQCSHVGLEPTVVVQPAVVRAQVLGKTIYLSSGPMVLNAGDRPHWGTQSHCGEFGAAVWGSKGNRFLNEFIQYFPNCCHMFYLWTLFKGDVVMQSLLHESWRKRLETSEPDIWSFLILLIHLVDVHKCSESNVHKSGFEMRTRWNKPQIRWDKPQTVQVSHIWDTSRYTNLRTNNFNPVFTQFKTSRNEAFNLYLMQNQIQD